MLKNNLISFIIHLSVGFITFYSFLFLGILFGNFESKVYGSIFFLASLILYCSLIYKFTSPEASIYKNLQKQISVFSVNILIWFATLMFFSKGLYDTSLNINWIPFYVFNAYSFPLIACFNISNALVLISFILIPLVLSVVTLEVKKYMSSKSVSS